MSKENNWFNKGVKQGSMIMIFILFWTNIWNLLNLLLHKSNDISLFLGILLVLLGIYLAIKRNLLSLLTGLSGFDLLFGLIVGLFGIDILYKLILSEIVILAIPPENMINLFLIGVIIGVFMESAKSVLAIFKTKEVRT